MSNVNVIPEYKVKDVVEIVNDKNEHDTGTIISIAKSRNDSIHMDFYTIETAGKNGTVVASASLSEWRILNKLSGGGRSKRRRRLSKKRKSNKKRSIRRKRR